MTLFSCRPPPPRLLFRLCCPRWAGSADAGFLGGGGAWRLLWGLTLAFVLPASVCAPCAAPGLCVASVGLGHVQSNGSVSVPGKAVCMYVCTCVCAHVCVRAPCLLTEPQCVLFQP